MQYSPKRIWDVFKVLLTIFLAIKKRDSFYGLSPLGPKELKITISKLGASFIKLAQVLATRSDFFNAQYLEELKTLHDNLQSMSTKEFKIVFESSFANKEIFTEFDEIAIASASIGQVHKATLRDGTKVAVKLRRHGIKQQVLADIKIITFFNKIFKPLFSQYTKNSIEAVITEFSKMIRQEISFKTELQNLISFSQTYKDSGINFPVAYEKFCSDSAIVMSFEEGFRFDDKENIFKHKIDFNKIIKNLVVFYTDQMLIKGFFHAISGDVMEFIVACASNSDAILNANLARSPLFAAGVPLHLERDAPSAGVAYNRALAATTAPVVVFAHHDVYLPQGWAIRLTSSDASGKIDWSITYDAPSRAAAGRG